MCGVVGFVGNGKVQEFLINGLEKLEYRGYDSAGIYVKDESHNGLFKEVGRIADLKATVDFDLPASIGIGHTRWATHGPATVENAHPHTSPNGRFVLVHNGVIENYTQIKEQYLADVNFYSDTDTEVAVTLVEHFSNEGIDTKAAFLKALSVIEGSYAFSLIDNEDPDTLYAAKNKSPLLVGLGEGFNLICSDAMAAIQMTNQYLEIHDKELVTLTENHVQIEKYSGEVVNRQPFIAELDADNLEKCTYPFYMIKEIDEQPTVIRRLISEYTNAEDQFEIEPELKADLLNADRIHIVACGTSYNAGWVGKSVIEKLTKTPVEVHLASEFSYDIPLLGNKPFFIFLTQSGETADSRQALVKVNELGYHSLTITNVKGSTLSREATYTMLLYAGPEIAVASTKAYTAQIAVMSIIAEAMRVERNLPALFDMHQELSKIAAIMEGVLSEKSMLEEWVQNNLIENRNAFYIGRLSDYYVTMEAALKLKEISYIQTEAFAAGELKHGTIALIEEGVPVIALISNPAVATHTRGNVEEVKARGAKAIVISTEEVANEDDFFILPNMPTLLAPLGVVVVTQLLAYYTALHRGLDVDKPRNLAKSVTVE